MNGIIFDFNGTMFFDGQLQEQAWREYLTNKTGHFITDKEFHEHVHGVNAEDTFKYFLKKDITREEVAELEEEKEAIYRALCLKSPDFKLADGIESLLDFLREQAIPMTIATASNVHNVRFFFENLGLDRWFDLEKVVLNDGTIKGKPNPDLFLKAAGNIEMDITNCIVLEDSPSGIQAGKNAKAKKIIGITSMVDENYLREKGATHIIHDYKDLSEITKLLLED